MIGILFKKGKSNAFLDGAGLERAAVEPWFRRVPIKTTVDIHASFHSLLSGGVLPLQRLADHAALQPDRELVRDGDSGQRSVRRRSRRSSTCSHHQ